MAAVQALLSTRSLRGLTPLHFAAASGSVALVEALLSRSADLDAVGCAFLGGVTPLMMACMKVHSRVVECLLRLGADRSIKACWGKL